MKDSTLLFMNAFTISGSVLIFAFTKEAMVLSALIFPVIALISFGAKLQGKGE